MNREAKGKWIVIVLAILLVISLTANVILAVKYANQPDDSQLSLYDPEYAIGKDDPIVVPEETEAPAPEQVISNSYIELICPADLKDQLSMATAQQEDGVTTVFTGMFDGKEVELFEIRLAKAEPADYYILGELQDTEDGTLYVAMHMSEIHPEEWSEELYSQICALQERVNDFIVQFYEDERFVPNH